jgi:hypothetical protein
MNLFYYNDPFPHVAGSMDESLYTHVLKLWDDLEEEDRKYNKVAGNRCNIEIRDSQIRDYLFNFSLKINAEFTESMLHHYPKLRQIEFRLDGRFLHSENKPSDTGYPIRSWHLDTGDKFLIGLWYFKHPEEEDDAGGDLLLMNPITKEHKTFKYEPNKIIIFPNLPTAWHAVTPRKPCKYPRRYINLLLESPDAKLHNYQRSGNSVDDEFRGKLINYYK